MQCPKCGARQRDGNAICERCGIVFAKYWKYHPRPGDPPRPAATRPSAKPDRLRPRGPLWDLLLPSQGPTEPGIAWARAALLAVLAVWGAVLIASSIASNAAGESILHLINLPFHEAGHVFFRPLGEFVASLGGTLGQLIMPAICCGVLLIQTRDPFGASVALWWLGENFLDIAPYIADARLGQLPLLGGNRGHSAPYGFHDWNYLLTETGLLAWDRHIALASHLIGSAVMLSAMTWGAVLVYRQLRRNATVE